MGAKNDLSLPTMEMNHGNIMGISVGSSHRGNPWEINEDIR